jgi:hypothetical protein
LLAHIAFHYVEGRTRYLAQVVENFASYELTRIEVVVDTNSEQTAEFLSTLRGAPHVSVRAEVNKNLSHPFGLTWAHRAPMTARHSEFDLCMYLEDDILITWNVLRAWLEDTEKLYDAGFLRGFLRVEENLDAHKVATDWMETQRPVVYEVAGGRYIQPYCPYQAFWVYTARQMRDFMKLPIWAGEGLHQASRLYRYDPKWWASPQSMRERAAYGMQYKNPGPHNVLLPLGPDGQISPDCHVHHLPNTYGVQPGIPLARHRVEELLEGEAVRHGSFRAFVLTNREKVSMGTRLAYYRARDNVRPWIQSSARFIGKAVGGKSSVDP